MFDFMLFVITSGLSINYASNGRVHLIKFQYRIEIRYHSRKKLDSANRLIFPGLMDHYPWNINLLVHE
jgi:hypothetical protein